MEEKEEVPNEEMPYEKSIHKEMGKKKSARSQRRNLSRGDDHRELLFFN
jgi:hypothetical protein